MDPIRLERRDRWALRYRLAATIVGFTVLAWAIGSGSWQRGWTMALHALIVVGGAAFHHLLTSIVSCPTCGSTLVNLAIARSSARKIFSCTRCGTAAYITEGFAWQSDTSG